MTTKTSSTHSLNVLKRRLKHKLHSRNRSLSTNKFLECIIVAQQSAPTANHDNEVTKQLVEEVVEESGGKWVEVVEESGGKWVDVVKKMGK